VRAKAKEKQQVETSGWKSKEQKSTGGEQRSHGTGAVGGEVVGGVVRGGRVISREVVGTGVAGREIVG